MQRAILICLLSSVVLLAGCPRPRVVEAPPARPAEVPAPQLAGARLYTLDPAASHAHVLVFRGGPMARLGHNHVMSVKALQGRVWIQPRALARSGFEMKFPVGEIVVDDSDARLAVGREDFPPNIPEKDKAGTRANMLREEVLGSAQHPFIALRSIRLEGELPQPTIVAAITLKGVTREVQVPAKIAIDERHVQAEGAFAIKQTEFGIKPFSVALGAVQVQDELQIRFVVYATRS